MAQEAKVPKSSRGGARPPRRNPHTQRILDAAYRMQKQGNLPQAELLYHQVLQEEPGNPFSLFGLGSIAVYRQEFEKAVPLLQQSIANGYHAETTYSHLGIALQSTGRLQEALELYQKGFRLDPKNPRYPSNMAVLLAQMGQPERALEEAERALQLDPTFASACLNAGSILLSLGRASEARGMMERAVQLDPANVEAREALRRLLEVPAPRGS